MAATPDTSSLTSSSQIFTTYTLPQVRAIHKSLHVQIDDKSARLRTQVGNSYRELLGTADTIVHMRHDMRDVQDILNRMGGLCGRAPVGDKVSNLTNFHDGINTNPSTERTATLRLLEACSLTVGRLLKGPSDGKGARLVLGAKTLVLSRLLLTSFNETVMLDEESRDIIEATKKKLVNLRKRLLRAIRKVLERTGQETEQADVLNALCAYSLASNSGVRDVLQHFLDIREGAIALELEADEHHHGGTANVLRGLDLYTKTLLDVQALVPNKLSGALLELQQRPLLADSALKALEGLRLDIYEKWCSQEIQDFTPYIRHHDLDGSQAKEMLVAWAKKGGKVLLSGLTSTLEHATEFKAIVELRTKVLLHWIQNGAKPKGFDPLVMLDGLRQVISARLLSLLENKASKLRLLGSEMVATLDSWQAGDTDRHRSLWDGDMLGMDISDGASLVTREVVSRLYGRNEAVSRAVTCYQSWYQFIDDVLELVGQLRRQRWNNDVDEIEGEDVIEARQELLSQEDPQDLHSRLNSTLEEAFASLHKQITALWHEHKDGPNSGHVAMYFLRILRDIRSRLPELDSVQSFGLENVPTLHARLVAHTATPPIENFASTALARRRVGARTLWEGEPALPAHPSPGAFKFLRNLVTAMGDAGLDLWTPAAVQCLKQEVSLQLVEAWRKEMDDEDTEAKSGDGRPDAAAESEKMEDAAEDKVSDKQQPERTSEDQQGDSKRDLYTQWLYDIYLLQQCLETDSDSESDEALQKFGGDIFQKTGLDSAAAERMDKASQEYWKRTSLLFGLLA